MSSIKTMLINYHSLTAWPPVPFRRHLDVGELEITSVGENGNQAEFNAFTNILSMLHVRLGTLDQGKTFYFLSPRVFVMGLASLAFSASIETRASTSASIVLQSVATTLNFMLANFGLRELTGNVIDNPNVGDNSIRVAKGRATRFIAGYDHLFAAMPSSPGVMLEFREGPTPLPATPDVREAALNAINDFIAHVSSDPMALFDRYTKVLLSRGYQYTFEMQADQPSQLINQDVQEIAQDISSIVANFARASFGADIRRLIGGEMKVIGGVRLSRQRFSIGATNGTEGVIFSR